MSCNTKLNSINALKEKNAIDKHGNIIDKNLFNKLNQDFTNLAQTKYGIDTEGKLLFTPVSFSKKYKITNDDYFNNLDKALEEYDLKHPKIKSLEDNSIEDKFILHSFSNTYEYMLNRDFTLKGTNNLKSNMKLFFNDMNVESNKYYDLNGVINNVLKNYNNYTDLSQEYLRKMQTFLKNSTAIVNLIDEADNFMSVTTYKNGLITLNINKKQLNRHSVQSTLNTFLHELAHTTSVAAYYNQAEPQHIEYRKEIDKIYEEYKKLSKLNISYTEYGFTNSKEFISEFYSNPYFRTAIKELSVINNVKSLIDKIIEAFSKLLGFNVTDKERANYRQVKKAVYDIVEHNLNEATLDIVYDKGDKKSFSLDKYEDKEIIIPSLENIKEKQEFVLDRIKTSLEISLSEYKKYIKRNKEDDPVKVQKVEEGLKEFQNLKNNIEEYAATNKWKAIITFTKQMNSNLTKLEQRLKKEDLNRDDARVIIERYENYLAAYNLLDEVSDLISDEQYNNSKEIKPKDRTQIQNLIAETAGKHKILTSNFKSAIKTFVTRDLSTLEHQPEVEKKWRDKLTKDYKDLKISTISLDEYISREMTNTYVDEIQEDVNVAANKTVNEVSFDISSITKYLNSAINTNSKLVQIFQNILNDIRDTIITKVRDNDQKLKELFEKFNKKGKPSQMYKNLIEQDSSGNYYLKGEYSIKFYDEYQKYLQLSKDSNNPDGKSELKSWLQYNTSKDSNGKRIPSKKWLNDLSNLSESEKETLDFFKNQSIEGDKMTFGIKSLATSYYDTKFYKLPSITQSDMERTLEGDVKGMVTDKWKDLTQIRPDDIGYQEKAVRVDNSSINYVPIHYRGKIDPKDQSLDLFTLYRLEYQNTVNFSVKQSREIELKNIIDIAEQKKYVKTTGVRIPIIGKVFNGNVQTIKGIESQTYKRLQSLMERNVYDVIHKYEGKISSVDVNKAIKLANSWTATIGLSLNVFSATANALNGNTQLFLESVGKNIFNRKDLRKAQQKYLADTSSNLSDIRKPIKTSFSNQLNQEFDTFGLATVSDQSFIRSNYLKSFADPATLQFMHQSGEHQMQSVLTMAVLNSVKVMDNNSNFIKKDGKEMTLLDAYSKNDDGILKLDERVVYTTHTPSIAYNKGGKTQINALVKKKIFDTMGNYDQQMQADATRYAAGKLFLMYRKYLMPLGVRRFRGFSKASKSKDKLKDQDRFFSYSLKDYEEGVYTSLVRHTFQGVIPAIKQMKYEVMSKDWDSLSDHEKSNIKIAITELLLTGVLLPMLGGIISHLAEGSDDEEYLYFMMYQFRRLESELSQYRDPTEAWKILRNPIPSMRVLESATEALYRTMTPWNWNEEYKSGKREGDLKILRSYEKLILILNKKDVSSKEMFKYIDSKFGI